MISKPYTPNASISNTDSIQLGYGHHPRALTKTDCTATFACALTTKTRYVHKITPTGYTQFH